MLQMTRNCRDNYWPLVALGVSMSAKSGAVLSVLIEMVLVVAKIIAKMA
jgi:hypothetical protein